jgi:Phage integrase family
VFAFMVRHDGCSRFRNGQAIAQPNSTTRARQAVDMSTALRDVLEGHQANLAEAWLQRRPDREADGTEAPKGDMPPWAFPSEVWTPMDHSNVGKAFKRVLKAAALPLHHSPHSLRHTFASLLLQQGEAIQYVQRMLGHASITLTVDTYGKWLPMGNKAAVDRLERDTVSPNWWQIGGRSHQSLKRRPQGVGGIGDPGRARTFNPEIKSAIHEDSIGSQEPLADKEYKTKED